MFHNHSYSNPFSIEKISNCTNYNDYMKTTYVKFEPEIYSQGMTFFHNFIIFFSLKVKEYTVKFFYCCFYFR